MTDRAANKLHAQSIDVTLSDGNKITVDLSNRIPGDSFTDPNYPGYKFELVFRQEEDHPDFDWTENSSGSYKLIVTEPSISGKEPNQFDVEVPDKYLESMDDIDAIKDVISNLTDGYLSDEGDKFTAVGLTGNENYVEENLGLFFGEDNIILTDNASNIFKPQGGQHIYSPLDLSISDAGAGNDVVIGGMSFEQLQLLISEKVNIILPNGELYMLSSSEITEYLNKNDIWFSEQKAEENDPDVLIGNIGEDLLFGQGGNDLLIGDSDVGILSQLAQSAGLDGNKYSEEALKEVTSTEDSAKLVQDLVDSILNFDDKGALLETVLSNESETDSNDTLYGGMGHDIIFGLAGNDYLSGGSGNDFLVGGSGNDYLAGGEGADELYADTGNDVLSFDVNDLMVDGGDGLDILLGNMTLDSLKDFDGEISNSEIIVLNSDSSNESVDGIMKELGIESDDSQIKVDSNYTKGEQHHIGGTYFTEYKGSGDTIILVQTDMIL